MSFWLALEQLWRDFRYQRLRTLLTVLGVMWGTASVVMLLALGTGLNAHVAVSFHGLGEKIMILWPGRTSLSFKGIPKGRALHFREEDAAVLLAEVPSIRDVSPEYSRWSVPVQFEKNRVSVNMVGIHPCFGDIRNIIPEPGGRFINDLDLKGQRRVVFIGDQLKKDLFGERTAVGKNIFIDGAPFLVVGVMKEKEQDSSYSGRDKDKAIIPATTFAMMTGYRYINNLVVQPHDVRDREIVTSGIYRALGRKYRFDPEDEEAIQIWDTAEWQEKFLLYFFLGFKIFLGILGGFTLVVGGIGVSNIMNAVVEERTREIGIKMAVGAKRKLILSQFLLETMVIMTIGGLLGFAVSWGIVKAVGLFDVEEYIGTPAISIPVAALTIGLLGVIGFLSGFFPARRAARLNPVQALKL